MNNKKELPLWARIGHGKPVTRREMIATGIIPFSATLFAPSLVTLLSKSASAASGQSCDNASASAMIPFITLNLSGGPAMSGNIVPRTVSGGQLDSLTKFGLGSGEGRSFEVATDFGGAAFPGAAIGGGNMGLPVSKFYDSVVTPFNGADTSNARSKTSFFYTAVASGDDTGSNHLDVTGMIQDMGLAGAQLPGLGVSDTPTGLGALSAKMPCPAPFVVGSVNDLTNALGYSSVVGQYKKSQHVAMAKLIADLSSEQARKLASMPGAEQMKKLIECVGIKNAELINVGSGDVNPFTATNQYGQQLADIWGVTLNNPNLGSQGAVFGAMVYNGLTGNCATVNLNTGGNDYHDNTRTNGDTKDAANGAIVGRILLTAELLNKPCFIYVIADGNVTAEETGVVDNTTVWKSDGGNRSASYCYYFNPAGRVTHITNTPHQIGGYSQGQATDQDFPTGADVEIAAQAIVVNYAAANNRMQYLDDKRILDGATRAMVQKIPVAS